MTVESAKYHDAANTMIEAVIDGATMVVPKSTVDANDGYIPRQVKAWLNAGNAVAPYVAPPPPPVSVTRGQAMIALHRAGLLDAVKTAVAADAEMQIWFDTAPNWTQDNDRVVAMAQVLGLSDQQVAVLFTEAQGVTP